MEMDAVWMENVLKRHHFNSSISYVRNVEKSNAVGKGENFLSTITRIKADVLVGSGKTKKVSLILKRQHVSPRSKELTVQYGFFFKEIAMYTEVLPKMEDLMNEFEDTDETLWSKCYDVKLYDMLLLEDLATTGHKVANRREQLNLKTACFVLKNLAKFHAMGSVLKERGEVNMETLSKRAMDLDPERSKLRVEGTFGSLADEMKSWGADWVGLGSRLRNSLPSLMSKIENFRNNYQKGFVVLNHGDCWTNNFLFRFDDEDNPISMKFVDLQLSFIGSPAHDFYYFLSTSVAPSIRKNNLNEMIRTYTHSLTSNLQKFGFTGKIPTVNDITEEFEKYPVLLLWNTIMLSPFILADPENATDIEEVVTKIEEEKARGVQKTSATDFSKLSDLIKSRIQFALLEAADAKLL